MLLEMEQDHHNKTMKLKYCFILFLIGQLNFLYPCIQHKQTKTTWQCMASRLEAF